MGYKKFSSVYPGNSVANGQDYQMDMSSEYMFRVRSDANEGLYKAVDHLAEALKSLQSVHPEKLINMDNIFLDSGIASRTSLSKTLAGLETAAIDAGHPRNAQYISDAIDSAKQKTEAA